MATKKLKDFTLISDELYFQGSGGVLARTMSKAEMEEDLQCIHDLYCGDNDITLYMRIHVPRIP